ncbi:MAG TPA: DUF1223 domain-containing protein [Chthonomonadaceae bacterium]|nr:DUF1223 domain-containing protein [Chthonomonadaceae bacterium]
MNSRIVWIMLIFGVMVVGIVGLASRWGMPRANGAETEKTVRNGEPKAAKTPVVVELFTSEGCSSCPPADALLKQLTTEQPIKDAEVIALAEHVDYWNHLGWRDPFSAKQFSDRQYTYARTLGLDNVYTPQMVVDGHTEFLGSDEGRAQAVISQAAKTPKVLVRITRTHPAGAAPNSAILDIRLDSLSSVSQGDKAQVSLLITEDKLRSDVARGENAGRNLVHYGVVRRWTDLGTAAPQQPFHATPTVTLDPTWKPANLSAVVLVQEQGSLHILGAGKISLK